MKNKFKEFYKYSDAEIKDIWDKCLFVFDTNVLLDLYRFSKETSESYLKILKKLSSERRIWIPHQVGLEFHRERIELIAELKSSYGTIKKIIENSFREAKSKIDEKYHGDHPFLNLKDITSDLEKWEKEIFKKIDDHEKGHPDWFSEDGILDELNGILEENVGDEFDQNRLSQIYKEGEERYSKKIPPGYEDATDKKDDRKYGDLIIWYQIIEKAKNLQKPIVFITRDKKEDWWWTQSGNTLGPRHELKKEMLDKAKVDFHMYSPERFLTFASEKYTDTVDKKTLKEVKRMSEMLQERELRNILAHRDITKLSNPEHIERLYSEIRHLPVEFSHELMELEERIRLLMRRIRPDEKNIEEIVEKIFDLFLRAARIIRSDRLEKNIDVANLSNLSYHFINLLDNFFEQLRVIKPEGVKKYLRQYDLIRHALRRNVMG